MAIGAAAVGLGLAGTRARAETLTEFRVGILGGEGFKSTRSVGDAAPDSFRPRTVVAARIEHTLFTHSRSVCIYPV